MNWLRNFMMGRYGADQLSFAIIIFYFALSLTAQLCGWLWLSLVSLVLLVILILRMFSRNVTARGKENAVFLRAWRPVQNWFRTQKKRLSDRTHRYFHCPSCSAMLRVPKGKGKISITCPKCGKDFVRKT